MEGRCLWIKPDDVDGPLDEGRDVTATRPLSDFCLRGDDGTEPVAPGTLLKVVELRPWGVAMAQELPAVQPPGTAAVAMAAAVPLRLYRGRANGVHVLTMRRGCVVARIWRDGSRWVLQTHDVERGTVETTRMPWCVARSEARFAVGARPVRLVREAMAQMRRGVLLLPGAGPAGAAA